MSNEPPTTTTAIVPPNGLSIPPVAETDDRISLLQQVYQQKQAELLQHFQRAQTNLALQHLTYFQALQHQQQAAALVSGTTGGSVSASDSPDGAVVVDTEMPSPSTNNNSQQSSSSTMASVAAMRNRRSFSGSGTTISQHTRDRLKNMIQKRGRTDSSSSLKSPTSTSTSTTVPVQVVSSPKHFEPYPVPSSTALQRSTEHYQQQQQQHHHSTEFQLRKVNSEPNLKMRIRAKLLNKGSSPVQTTAFSFPQPGQHQQQQQHRLLHRSDSDTAPMDTTTSSLLSPPSAPFPHLMLPSPSLPNLGTQQQPLSMDMAALMAQAAFSSFLSMPSLLKSNSLLGSETFETNDAFARDLSLGAGRQAVKFDSTRSFTSPLPIGGYPSLLKQQLRDLVLRRKSLVREEPEDEAELLAMHAENLNRLANGAIQSSELKTGLAYDSAMSKHQCLCGQNRNHVEHGGRVHSIWARLGERGLVERCERVPARKAPLELLRSVHSTTYVTFFAVSPTACLKIDPAQLPLRSFVQLPCGGIGVDSDTYFNDANTQLATRIAVGSLVELCSQVAEGKLKNGFAVIRPPGHHAERDLAMGFCFFNNVAIAVRHLQQRYSEQCGKIAIIDWDVHHGNGTQLCFEADPNVLYLSLHRHDNGNFFPGTGAVTEVGTGLGKGMTVNVPFSGEAMGDPEYLAAWRIIVVPVLEQFQPDFIVVSAGFDAARGHPAALGGYELTPQMFGFMTSQLMNYADGRVVLALEGGYDLAAISDSAEECVKVLSDDERAGKLSEMAMNGVPKEAAQETIQKVVAIHKKHWQLTGAQGINMSEATWQTVGQRFASLTVHGS